jgi:hypothetical protein
MNVLQGLGEKTWQHGFALSAITNGPMKEIKNQDIVHPVVAPTYMFRKLKNN